MRHGFDLGDPLSFGLLALIEAFDLRIVTNRKVRRLDKRPGPILVAVLDIPLAFAFAVTQFLTAHTATVRRKIPDRRKTPNLPRLQHDRHAQNLPDPTDGE